VSEKVTEFLFTTLWLVAVGLVVLSFALGLQFDPASAQGSVVVYTTPLPVWHGRATVVATERPKIPRCPVGYHRIGHVCRLVLPRHEKSRVK